MCVFALKLAQVSASLSKRQREPLKLALCHLLDCVCVSACELLFEVRALHTLTQTYRQTDTCPTATAGEFIKSTFLARLI